MERSNVINLLGYWSGVDENVKTVRTFEGCPIFLIDIHCSQLTYALQVNSSLESVGKTAMFLAFFLLTCDIIQLINCVLSPCEVAFDFQTAHEVG